MKIRKANYKDFELLKELKSSMFLFECKLNSRLNPKYVKHGLGVRLAKNLKQKNIIFYIAESNGNVIGFVGAEIIRNKPSNTYNKKGFLFSLYVKPEYRNKGIAKKLLKKMLAWFKKHNISDLVIETHVNNKQARSLYEKFGYRSNTITMTRKI